MGYYLMIKEAEGLGVKYLCKCGDYKDPHTYKGSGVFWRKIIRKHNCNIKTTILGYYDTAEELRLAGEHYSIEFDIVNDRSWANLIPEIGDGGPTVKGKVRAFNLETKQQKFFASEDDIPEGWKRGSPKWTKNRDGVEKSRQAHLGAKRSDKTRQRMREGNVGKQNHPYFGCKHCGKQFTIQNLRRHEVKCDI